MRDLETFIAGLHDYIGKALAPLAEKVRALDEAADARAEADGQRFIALSASTDNRLKAIEAREPQKGDPGADGPTVEELEPVIRSLVTEAANLIPGMVIEAVNDRAKEWTPDPAAITDAVEAAVKALPPAERGEPGKSITVDDVRAVLDVALAQWELQAERRFVEFCQRSVDAMPKPKDGEDGQDALGFDDMTIEHDGRRKFALVFSREGREVRKEFALPVVLDAGFWQPGMEVEAGDGVTLGGSYWIAQKATGTQPEVGNPDWRLAVRKGRDSRGRVATDEPKKNGPVRIGSADA